MQYLVLENTLSHFKTIHTATLLNQAMKIRFNL